jgi:Peptidase dimerisation domain
MRERARNSLVTLPLDAPIWERTFTVNPLVLIGTEEGASATLELSYLIQALFALNDPARGTTVNVGTIDGGLRPNVVAPQSKAVRHGFLPERKHAAWRRRY